MKPTDLPEPGSVEEKAAYATLEERTKTLYRALSADQRIPQTVVIVPSLSMENWVAAVLSFPAAS